MEMMPSFSLSSARLVQGYKWKTSRFLKFPFLSSQPPPDKQLLIDNFRCFLTTKLLSRCAEMISPVAGRLDLRGRFDFIENLGIS
jgi:hypothetical protein